MKTSRVICSVVGVAAICAIAAQASASITANVPVFAPGFFAGDVELRQFNSQGLTIDRATFGAFNGQFPNQVTMRVGFFAGTSQAAMVGQNFNGQTIANCTLVNAVLGTTKLGTCSAVPQRYALATD